MSPSPVGLGSGERSRPEPTADAWAATGAQPAATTDAAPCGIAVGVLATLAALDRQDVSVRNAAAAGCGAARATAAGAAAPPDASAKPAPNPSSPSSSAASGR
eukprot:3353427-Pyramimonas_sp.AAC.2